jgi:hypothetical protein
VTDAYRLNEYRKRAANKLPKIIVEGGGCGAGGLTVRIATDPRGGQILIIPVFFYQLCKAQNLAPEDFKLCDRWREIPDGFNAEVSGDYNYIVRWSNGGRREGVLPFSSMGDGEKKLTLRAPR